MRFYGPETMGDSFGPRRQADMNDDGKLSEEEFVDFFVDHIIVNGFESAQSA